MNSRLIATQRHTHLQPEYAIKPGKTRLGRHPDNDIVVMLESISRYHAEFETSEDGGTIVRDLGSRNGTFLNGHRVRESVPVGSADRVQFGNVEFVFRATDLSDQALKAQGETNVNISKTPHMDMEVMATRSLDSLIKNVTNGRGGDTGTDPLLLVYHTGLWLRQQRMRLNGPERAKALQELLDRLFAIIPASRGAVLMRTKTDGPLVPVASMRSETRKAGSSPTIDIPQAIMDAVQRDGQALLMGNPAEDERFARSESIAELKIISAICVPIVAATGPLGLIYLDSQGRDSHLFTEVEFAIAGSVAHELGFALDGVQRVGGDPSGTGPGAGTGPQPKAGAGAWQALATQLRRVLSADRENLEKLTVALEEGRLHEARQSWRLARRAIRRVETLVQDIDDFSKAGTARRLPTNVAELITNLVDTYKDDMAGRQIEAKIDLGAARGSFLIDEETFYKAMLAVFHNALDAVGPNGVVGIKAGLEADGALKINVTDNGPGLPPPVMERLFEPFNPGVESRGNGMGLALAKKFLVAMGGDVTLTSKPDAGTTVTIALPPSARVAGSRTVAMKES